MYLHGFKKRNINIGIFWIIVIKFWTTHNNPVSYEQMASKKNVQIKYFKLYSNISRILTNKNFFIIKGPRIYLKEVKLKFNKSLLHANN